MTIGDTLYKLYHMVDRFVNDHAWDWEIVRTKHEEEHGYTIGRTLSLQSHIASDMLIDMSYLAINAEAKEPFTLEYWIRSNGTHCINNKEHSDACRKTFNDIIAKIKIEFDGNEFTNVSWFEDEDCKVKNKHITK